MTEKVFFEFLNKRGRADMVLESVSAGDVAIGAAGEFINAHALLPKGYDNLPEDYIVSIGDLLFQKGLELRTKKAILILLAHQVSDTALTILTKFNLSSGSELKSFARLALDESLMWNE